MRRILQAQRDGAHRAEVFRHVLPYLAIPAGRTADKDAVDILQRDGQAVHLWLHNPVGRLDLLSHPLEEGVQLSGVKHILQRLERNLMANLLECLQRLPPHPLGGRIRRNQLRMLLLELLKLSQQHIIFVVRDDGGVQVVIPVVPLVERPTVLLKLCLNVHTVTLSPLRA